MTQPNRYLTYEILTMTQPIGIEHIKCWPWRKQLVLTYEILAVTQLLGINIWNFDHEATYRYYY